MTVFTKLGRDIAAPVDSAGNPRQIVPQDFQVWMTEVERVVDAFTSNGGLIYDTRASLDADLAHPANSSAWVVSDSTAANNGIYRKTGASGSGSWTRIADLPYSFIRAADAGAGTPNAIQATTSIPVPSADGAALIALNIFENNTGPATVSFNGGTALTIKTNSGADVQENYLIAGMIVAGYVSGDTFRLISDVSSAADRAAAEAAADRAEAAAAGVNLPSIQDGDAGKLLTVKLTEDGYELVDTISPVEADLTVNIPTDYPTLQEAIDALSMRPVKQGARIILMIESGHIPASGISVGYGDYGHFTVSAEDAVVTTHSSFTGRFIEATHAIAPVLNCYVDGNGVLDRVYSCFSSIGRVNANCGGQNVTGRILYGNNSLINAGNTIWRDFLDSIYFSAGSAVQLGGALIEGGIVTANGTLTVSRGSKVEAQLLTMRNCTVAVEVKRAGSSLNCHGATFENITNLVCRVHRSASFSAEDAVITGVGADGIEANTLGRASLNGASITAAVGNTGNGLQAQGGGEIEFTVGTVSGFGVYNMFANAGGRISAWEASTTGAGQHGAFADRGGQIVLNDGTASGNAGDDLRILRGSQIYANGVTTTSSTGTPALADTNAAVFNAIDAAKGIIWT